MDIGIDSIITLGIALVSVAVMWGTIKTKLDNLGEKVGKMEALESLPPRVDTLEKRAEEDRCGNRERFGELYESRNEMRSELVETVAQLKSICDRLERIEPKLDKLIERSAG